MEKQGVNEYVVKGIMHNPGPGNGCHFLFDWVLVLQIKRESSELLNRL